MRFHACLIAAPQPTATSRIVRAAVKPCTLQKTQTADRIGVALAIGGPSGLGEHDLEEAGMGVGSEDTSKTHNPESNEPVWTFRGYELQPREFTTAMVHLFRGEITRANVWRQRLDATTNWAVITTGAAISIAFTGTSIGNLDHLVIVLCTLLISFLLHIEARRYRYYELWSYRVRLMETDFYAAMLVPPFRPDPDWAETLAESLLHPDFPISIWEALGRRLRRNYIWMYMILALAWVMKIWLHPELPTRFADIFKRATVGGVPGVVIIAAGIVFYAMVIALALFTVRLQQATGEVLPRFGEGQKSVPPEQSRFKKAAWFRPSRRRRQFMAFIITDQAQKVSDQILRQMGRGVTAVEGVGMYTQRKHSVLMSALTVTEVPQLKAIVDAIDPRAFVVVSPAQEVLGEGFQPLNLDE